MTVSALTLPSLGFATVQLRQRSVVGVGVSPFTGEAQVFAHQGQWWEASVSYPRRSRAIIAPPLAALVSLNGPEGTFLLGDPLAAVPLGTATGTPLVSGANAARATTLATKGWTTGVTGILKASDWIQLGSGATARLHMVTADADSDGSGDATLSIWPALGADHSDGEAITVTSAKGLFRLKTAIPWDIDQAARFGLTFEAFSVTP